MAGIAQNGQKHLIFIVVTQVKTKMREKGKREKRKKKEKTSKQTASKLFQIQGLIQEIAFCPMFVLRKGILSLEKVFLVLILQCGTNSKISFSYKGKCY